MKRKNRQNLIFQQQLWKHYTTNISESQPFLRKITKNFEKAQNYCSKFCGIFTLFILEICEKITQKLVNNMRKNVYFFSRCCGFIFFKYEIS